MGQSKANERQFVDDKYLGSNEVSDSNMIEPEGLTPGYKGHGVDESFSYGVKPVMQEGEVELEEGIVSDPKLQMAELLEQKIEATLQGNFEKAREIEDMIVMHAKRNDLEYKPAPELN